MQVSGSAAGGGGAEDGGGGGTGSNDLSEKLLSSHTQDNEEEVHIMHQHLLAQNHSSSFFVPTIRPHNYNPVIAIPDQSSSLFRSSCGTGDPQVDVEQGTKQPDRYRDLLFLVLFVANVGNVLYWGFTRGISSLNYDPSSSGSGGGGSSDGGIVLHFGGMFLILLGGVLVSLVQTSILVSILVRYAQHLIPASLLLAGVLGLGAAAVFMAQNFTWGAILGFGVAAYSGWYAYCIWNRIPLASATLQTALTAIQLNSGISLVAYGMVMTSLLYTVFWMLAWIGIFVSSTGSTCTVSSSSSSSSPSSSGYGASGGSVAAIECDYATQNPLAVGFMLLSYAWTTQVISNCLHVTVSGVVGTFWFAPELAGSWWSPAISDSWIRSVTYSLGSVCLGSLLVSILHVSHALLTALKRSSSPCGSNNHCARNVSITACVADCLLSFLGRLIAYFNKYAFTYIGLYGYDFLEAGHRAYELFQHRGWTTVVQDDLIARVLVLASWVVGLCTAAVGVVLVLSHPTWTYDDGASTSLLWSFVLCLLVGTVVSRTILGVVASACDTVLVCFAEAPRELEQNHPGLHRNLTQAWQRVYPEEERSTTTDYVL